VLEDRKPVGLIGEVVLGIVEGLHRNEALVRERLLKLELTAGLRQLILGLVEIAKVRIVRVDQRELLAAHVVELLLDLGLLLERRQLELGIREDGEELSLRHLGAILDELLLDLAAFDRVEINGDQGRHPRTDGEKVLEDALLRGADRQPVLSHRHRIGAWSEQPEDEQEQEDRRSAARDEDPLVDPLANDDTVHRAAADSFRAARLAQLDQAHCPAPNSCCPDADADWSLLRLAPS
jgi:hypothetical protein